MSPRQAREQVHGAGVELGPVVHHRVNGAVDHVADVRVATALRTHVLRELPPRGVLRPFHLEVAQVDDIDLDAALLRLLVRLIERAARGLAHGGHDCLPSRFALAATLTVSRDSLDGQLPSVVARDPSPVRAATLVPCRGSSGSTTSPWRSAISTKRSRSTAGSSSSSSAAACPGSP